MKECDEMIYFDNSATTPVNEEVLSSFMTVTKSFYANPASIHELGREAERLLESARQQILDLLAVPKGTILFTSGGTEANNTAINGFAHARRHIGKHIITTKIEHPSVLKACERLASEGFHVDYLDVDIEGVVQLEQLERLLTKETTLVSIMHVNNETGATQPLQKCAELIRQFAPRAIFHSDCVQSFGKLPVNFDVLDLDALTISGHKIHGLKGTGILAYKQHTQLLPLIIGGGQESGLRSGTVAVPNAVSLAKAMRIASTHIDEQQFHSWRNKMIHFMSRFEDIQVLSRQSGAPHILTVAFPHIKGEVAVNFFQQHGIYVSTSSACSSKTTKVSHVIEAMSVDNSHQYGVIRLSFGQQNTSEQLEQFKTVCKQFMELLERGK